MVELDTTSDFFDAPTDADVSASGRPRPTRPPLVPPWVMIAAAVTVGVLVIVTAGVVVLNSVSAVSTPKVVGLEQSAAETQAAANHLKVVATERRFSLKPPGTIIEQAPPAGTKVRRGETIRVVVSAGTEEFAMPDVTGNGLVLARGILEGKGLELRVEMESSDQPSDTVLATNPSPGVMVRTGSIVRVTVAGPSGAGSALLPMNLQGVAVTIDPAPTPGGQTDISLEVARRLRSLIEASGGTVTATRSMTDTGAAASASIRARRAKEDSASVAIGLEVADTGPGGIEAMYPLTGTTAVLEPSRVLATGIATKLVASGLSAKASTVDTDQVLTATKAPWSRVRLGSMRASDDITNFRDPKWADTVARSIYGALAEVYGVKGASR